MDTEAQNKNQIDLIIAKLQRKKRNMSESDLVHFADLANGLNPTQFIDSLQDMTTKQAREHILQNNKLFEFVQDCIAYMLGHIVISDHEDELISHSRGYGNGKTPHDYLEEFNEFINSNINTIAALEMICTRPSDLTRESLKSLKLELDRHKFTEKQLNTAWRELKNEDIAADIISYIRRGALGSPLISAEERTKRAVEKLRKNHNLNKIQLDWLARIEKVLIAETIIDRSTFDDGSFKTQGGFERINKAFSGKLEIYLRELNTYLYEDGGIPA